MNEPVHSIIAVVDDDASVCRALERLLRSAGHRARTFACAQELLQYRDLHEFACVVLDVQLPGLNGLELQVALEKLEHAPCIVFLTGYGDIPMTVRAMRAGAVDFLTKPCDELELLHAVERALEVDAAHRHREGELQAERKRIDSLTGREREVLGGVVAGLLNKQIAARLGICEKTVKVHRAHIMEKTGVRSVAELVRICEHVGLQRAVRTSAGIATG